MSPALRVVAACYVALRRDMLSVLLHEVSLPKEAYSIQYGSTCLIDQFFDFLNVLIRCESTVACAVTVVKYNDHMKYYIYEPLCSEESPFHYAAHGRRVAGCLLGPFHGRECLERGHFHSKAYAFVRAHFVGRPKGASKGATHRTTIFASSRYCSSFIQTHCRKKEKDTHR